MEESTHGFISLGEIEFGKRRFETFRECFEASNDFFWGVKLFHVGVAHFHPIIHTETFPMTQEAGQS